MFEVDNLSSFSPNCQKITWGHLMPPRCPPSWEAPGTPVMPPCYFFSKNKNYLPNQMHTVFFLRTKTTWGGVMSPHDALIMGGAGGIRHPPHDTPMLFFDNLVKKNLTVAGVLRKKKFGFPYLSLSLILSHKGKIL